MMQTAGLRRGQIPRASGPGSPFPSRWDTPASAPSSLPPIWTRGPAAYHPLPFKSGTPPPAQQNIRHLPEFPSKVCPALPKPTSKSGCAVGLSQRSRPAASRRPSTATAGPFGGRGPSGTATATTTTTISPGGGPESTLHQHQIIVMLNENKTSVEEMTHLLVISTLLCNTL